jgi:hypothetical protein
MVNGRKEKSLSLLLLFEETLPEYVKLGYVRYAVRALVPKPLVWEFKCDFISITCVEYNRCRPYREMLTYKPLTNNFKK